MSLGLRERKKQATRASLAAAALRLAAERGPDHVTVEQIAEAAGVSPRTFFNHFCTKEEAFVADDLDRARALMERMRTEPLEQPVWPLLTRNLGAFLDVGHDREQTRAQYAVRMSPAVVAQQQAQYASLEADLVEELARRLPNGDRLRARLLAGAAVAAMRAAVETWVVDDQDRTLPQLFDLAVDHLTPAFAKES
jgi:AcrR family transcriptional regulator